MKDWKSARFWTSWIRGQERTAKVPEYSGFLTRLRAYPSRSMIRPTFEEFSELSRQGNIIPLSKAVTADLLTPVLAYLKVEAGMSHAFLLESVEGGEKIA